MSDQKRILGLTLGALGVVFGDIGTSPLYAFRVTMEGLGNSAENVFGVLSLIFWSLILIISIKYLLIILRADNEGEGGIFALYALLLKRIPKKAFFWVLLCSIVGATLLLGDGMITPAISVISAMEGLNLISPTFNHLIIPFTIVILLALFIMQRHGTGKIGVYFGPMILVWFFTIGILGGIQIAQTPEVLKALNPYYAIALFIHHAGIAYLLLGGIFLVVTGGEALYADIGHFGKSAVRIGWFAIALPGLVLNYFGQGAAVLRNPAMLAHPFYSLAPHCFEYPLIILATIATVIASQAVISATFSLANQAVSLDICPHLNVIQTSAQERGQVYVPFINVIVGIGTLLLVLVFKTSIALAHAYGIAVNLVMVTVVLLIVAVAKYQWNWSWPKIALILSWFVVIDLIFLGANLQKIGQGGWVPLCFALVGSILLYTWYRGMQYLHTRYYGDKVSLPRIVQSIRESSNLHRLTDMNAVFIADPYDESGGGFLHSLKLNQILPDRVIVVNFVTEDRPYVSYQDQFEFSEIAEGIYRFVVHYGYMQVVNVPLALKAAAQQNMITFEIDLERVVYFTEIMQISVTQRKVPMLFHWQKQIFAFFLHNASPDIQYYQLPYNRTVAIGAYCEI